MIRDACIGGAGACQRALTELRLRAPGWMARTLYRAASMAPQNLAPGAHVGPEGTRFVVCSTAANEVSVRLFDEDGKSARRTVALTRNGPRFEALLADVNEGALYKLVLDGDELPDPYARFLPFGVHGPARVIATASEPPLASPPPAHRWTIYELHVGTFTEEGTYRTAAARLDEIADLGVSAIEILPVAAFAGARGWGYDGVALYAPHAPYGDPDDLRAFVREAHARGLAVILDVVYNHFGPAGNYLSRYAPEYFTSKVQTPWGPSPDYTWAPMRKLVLESVTYWLDEFGFDGLRIDAAHEIHDASSTHPRSSSSTMQTGSGRTTSITRSTPCSPASRRATTAPTSRPSPRSRSASGAGGCTPASRMRRGRGDREESPPPA